MDLRQPLPGALVIGLVHVPFVWEVALQLRLAARLYERLPPAVRWAPQEAQAASLAGSQEAPLAGVPFRSCRAEPASFVLEIRSITSHKIHYVNF